MGREARARQAQRAAEPPQPKKVKIQWYVAVDGSPLFALVRHPSRWDICVARWEGDTTAEIAAGIVDALKVHGITEHEAEARTETLPHVQTPVPTSTKAAAAAIIKEFERRRKDA